MRAPEAKAGSSDGTGADDEQAPFETSETGGAVALVQRRSAPEDAAGPMVTEDLVDRPVDDYGKGEPHDHRLAGSVEREAELDDLLERLEARLLDEIDRRGGRYGGKF